MLNPDDLKKRLQYLRNSPKVPGDVGTQRALDEIECNIRFKVLDVSDSSLCTLEKVYLNFHR